jgi:hypothetical protein
MYHWWRDFYFMPHLIASNADLVINKSLWNSHAWTFQERVLSRRCIIVTTHQNYFMCSITTWEEEFCYYMSSHPITPLSRITVDRECARNIANYYEYVDSYTSRSLTFEADILIAFAGVTNVLNARLDTPFAHGVQERYFPKALLWTHAERQRRREPLDQFPTWSWAGWVGKVIDLGGSNNECSLSRARDTGSLVKLLHTGARWNSSPSSF